ncbi:MAG: hypothetical protein C0599_11810 [Salinivirgaceae bacterium]|nr:MAG: hypothetical protein C0599_11810 [Salinivirgaceae bacterium]
MKQLKQILKKIPIWYNMLRLDVVSESALMLVAVLLLVLFLQLGKESPEEKHPNPKDTISKEILVSKTPKSNKLNSMETFSFEPNTTYLTFK